MARFKGGKIGNTPYVGFGNDELDKATNLGVNATCPGCGLIHAVEYGDEIKEDGTRVPSFLLAFVKCPTDGRSFLVGIRGKEV